MQNTECKMQSSEFGFKAGALDFCNTTFAGRLPIGACGTEAAGGHCLIRYQTGGRVFAAGASASASISGSSVRSGDGFRFQI